MLAMRRAVDDLGVVPGHVLVDGNRLPELPCPATAVVVDRDTRLELKDHSVI